MFDLILSKEMFGRVVPLTVRGVCGNDAEVIWDIPIDYMLAKHFVDALNEHNLPEEELFKATHEFLIAIQ